MNKTNNCNISTISNHSINKRQNKKGNTKILIIIVISIAIFIVGSVFVFNLFHNKNYEDLMTEENSSNTYENIHSSTNTVHDENENFLLRIEDTFTISGRGTCVTGTVERGVVKKNDEVQIIGLDKETITTTVSGIEIFKSDLEQASVGENVAIFLQDVERDQVQKGQVLAKPNSIAAVKSFEANLSVLSPEDGGRNTPFFDGFSPKFYFLTYISGTIKLPKDKEMIMPGESALVTIMLEKAIAMEVGTEFYVKEGGRTIAKGKVIKIY